MANKSYDLTGGSMLLYACLRYLVFFATGAPSLLSAELVSATFSSYQSLLAFRINSLRFIATSILPLNTIA